jgi:hypothetical protein
LWLLTFGRDYLLFVRRANRTEGTISAFEEAGIRCEIAGADIRGGFQDGQPSLL